jgi:thiol-disulfide isomerase/thioredoxin
VRPRHDTAQAQGHSRVAASTGVYAVVVNTSRRRIVAGALAWSAAACARAQSDEAKAPPLPALGTPLPVPAIERLDGTRFEPREAEGRVLVLYWWASWCPFCALTSPHVEALWRAQRERGLMLLGLSIDKTAAPASAYLARHGYTFPAAWVTPAFARSLPKPRGLPVTLVRGRDGRVVQAEAGQLFPEDVQALARHL